MNNLAALSHMSFFTASRYNYSWEHLHDFRDCPRPHFCMGLIQKGTGVFYSDDREVTVVPGDIIVVPMFARYLSRWRGAPDIQYTSIHFSFEVGGLFCGKRIAGIQKIHLPDTQRLENDFQFMYDHYTGSESEKLLVLSCFFHLIADISVHLQYAEIEVLDERVRAAKDYIDLHYADPLEISSLAKLSNISDSYFFPLFRKALKMTPVEYINKVRIDHSILLLIGNPEITVEEVSSITGFESSTYFRRVFKNLTGKTPREYRNTFIEL